MPTKGSAQSEAERAPVELRRERRLAGQAPTGRRQRRSCLAASDEAAHASSDSGAAGVAGVAVQFGPRDCKRRLGAAATAGVNRLFTTDQDKVNSVASHEAPRRSASGAIADVPLPRLSGRTDLSDGSRLRAVAFARPPVASRGRGQDRDQRRRLRHRLVRRAARARASTARCARPGRTRTCARLCDQVRSGLFFAHVRASTGTATTRANCHPFAHGRYLFMHNGQIGGYARIKRRLEALIPDDLYEARARHDGFRGDLPARPRQRAGEDPVGAMARTLKQVRALMGEAGDRRGAAIHRRRHRRREPLGLSLGVRRQPADPLFPRGRRQPSRRLRADRRQDEGLARSAEGLQPGGARSGCETRVECLNEAMALVAA